MDGGYDIGYQMCPCFWGRDPGRLVKKLALDRDFFRGLQVLDAGCGEGKNAAFVAADGAQVLGMDISEIAIDHARKLWPSNLSITWKLADVRSAILPEDNFDVVIAYGLLHCLGNKADVTEVIRRLQGYTRPGGYNVVAVLNGRCQDLRAHPELKPCWLPHEWYADAYSAWQKLQCNDSDLTEIHPHNNIWHTHSITRILARKGP